MALTWKATLSERDAPPRLPASRVTTTPGSSFLRDLLVGLDTGALALAWFAATALAPAKPRSALVVLLVSASFVAGGLVIFGVQGLYRARVCNLRTVEYARLARGCLVLSLLGLAVASLAGSFVTPGEIAVGASLTFVFAIVGRSGYRTWITARRRSGRFLRSVLLVGTSDEAVEFRALLSQHPELGYRAVGAVGDLVDARVHGLEDLRRGDLTDAVRLVDALGVTGVVVCGADLHSDELNRTVQDLLDAGAHVQLSSGLRGIDVGRLRPSPLAHEPVFYVEPMTLAGWQLACKRVLDVGFGSIVFALSSPLLLVAAIGIKLGDRGPVLYKQQRVGRHGEPFTLYKLRTMREGAEHETLDLLNGRDGPLLKVPHDPRVTRIGRFLRATSIDELPQLWNVLNGTMSLVGPRPALPNEVVHFGEELRAREAVRPGLTGLWQVEGRDNPSFAAYRRFDLFYLQNWCVALDLMILLGTIESVITRIIHGILHPGVEIQLAPPEVVDPVRLTSRPGLGAFPRYGYSSAFESNDATPAEVSRCLPRTHV